MFHIELYEAMLTDYVPYTKELSEFTYSLRDDDPQMKYTEFTNVKGNKQVLRDTIFQGARKLLLTELYFFVKMKRKWEDYDRIIVVYIGVAPATHLLLLWDLLGYDKRFEWHLYDKEKFDPQIIDISRIDPKHVKIFNEYFTEQTFENYEDERVILISQLRNVDLDKSVYPTLARGKQTDIAYLENQVLIDNALNKRIYESMKPLCALIRFRVPYQYDGAMKKYVYLKGEALFQPWVGLQSTETRLIVDECEEFEWDCEKYENQMFYHNVLARTCMFVTDDEEFQAYCPCWHCTFEISVLLLFYRTMCPNVAVKNVYKNESELIDWVLGKKLYALGKTFTQLGMK